jgi:hypothetical protein
MVRRELAQRRHHIAQLIAIARGCMKARAHLAARLNARQEFERRAALRFQSAWRARAQRRLFVAAVKRDIFADLQSLFSAWRNAHVSLFERSFFITVCVPELKSLSLPNQKFMPFELMNVRNELFVHVATYRALIQQELNRARSFQSVCRMILPN